MPKGPQGQKRPADVIGNAQGAAADRAHHTRQDRRAHRRTQLGSVAGRLGSLGLVLTPQGYELTATPERFNGAAMPDRVTIPREDGKPMAHGHCLTDREREVAVRAILGG